MFYKDSRELFMLQLTPKSGEAERDTESWGNWARNVGTSNRNQAELFKPVGGGRTRETLRTH